MNSNGERKRFYLALINVSLLVISLGATVYFLLRPPSEQNNVMISIFSLVVGIVAQEYRAMQRYWFTGKDDAPK